MLPASATVTEGKVYYSFPVHHRQSSIYIVTTSLGPLSTSADSVVVLTHPKTRLWTKQELEEDPLDVARPGSVQVAKHFCR
jgi:hypothetical protein